MEVGKLVTAANEMYELIADLPVVEQEQLVRAAHIACSTLQDLVDEQDFYRDVKDLAELQKQNLYWYEQLTKDEHHFKPFFLLEEKMFLTRHQFNSHLGDVLIQTAVENLQALRHHRIEPEAIRTELQRLCTTTCDAARYPDRTLSLLRTISEAVYVVSGAAIMSLTAASPNRQLTPIGLAVSGTLGSALIGTVKSLADSLRFAAGNLFEPKVFDAPPDAHLVLEDQNANVMTLDLYTADYLAAKGLLLDADPGYPSLVNNIQLRVTPDVVKDIQESQTQESQPSILTAPLGEVDELEEEVSYRNRSLKLSISSHDRERHIWRGKITNQGTEDTVDFRVRQSSPSNPNLKPVSLAIIVWSISCADDNREATMLDAKADCRHDARQACRAHGKKVKDLDTLFTWGYPVDECQAECQYRCS